MSIGMGIAIAGIWTGVGLVAVGTRDGAAACFASLFAMIATIVVACAIE